MRPAVSSLRRAGFTLVEMSIVLLVIGLIIGGIMVGQEVVHAGEINSIITDVNRIKASVTTFRLKYNAWPGDMPNATSYWSGTVNGNGNSSLDYGPGWTGESEWFRFWQHLSLASMIPGSFTGVTASTSDIASSVVIGTNMMGNRMGGFYAVTACSDALHEANNCVGIWGANPNLYPLSPIDAKTIDSKMDDGRPGTGAVTGSNVASGCMTGATLQVAVYNVNREDAVCGMAYWFNSNQ